MKAVVFHGPGEMRVEDVPEPPCATDEIRVKVDACAVCGSDLKAFRVGNPRIKPPMVVGHEFTGLVDRVGGEVRDFQVGDRIVMATSVSCGDCAYCRLGHPNLCVDLAPMGYSYPGGMAEFVTLPARALKNGHAIKVPAEVPAARAALAEPLSCAVNAAENAGIREGDTVVVVGAGPMGILNGCVARQCGANQILLAEINPARLTQAEAFGFDRLVNPAEEDLREIVLSATAGLGADVVIVAAPAAEPQEQALLLARKRGTICLFASLPSGNSEITLDSRLLHYGELKVVGSSDSTPAQVATAVKMLADDAFPADKLVTHSLGLDGIEEAFELMTQGEALRVVLTP